MGQIYFSSPLKFNDPFELSAKVRISSSPSLYGLNKREIEEVSRLFRLTCPEAVSDSWKENIGILCLSENPQHILMWSHYGANHTGVCIGFDSGVYPFDNASEVKYQDDRPYVGYETSSENLLERVLLTKSQHWGYEREWRVIKRSIGAEERDFYYERYRSGNACLDEIANLIASNSGPGLYDFEPDAVRSIFFGARIRPELRLKIINFVKEHKPTVKLFDIELDGQYFWLNKKRVRLP